MAKKVYENIDKGFIMKLLKRAFKSMFGASNVPFYIDSDTKREIYPNKWEIEQGKTEVSHIVLTDEYPDAKILVEYFNLDPAKVVFFVKTNKVYIPYSNPIGILKDTDDSCGAVFVDTPDNLSLSSYLYNVTIPFDAYRRNRFEFGDFVINDLSSGVEIREKLNSIFHDFPTEIALLQVMFGSEKRNIPKKLEKYLSKLDITPGDSPIFYSLVYGNKRFREKLKAFESKYREAKMKATSKKKVFPNPYIEYEMMSQESWDKLEKAKKEGEIIDVIDYKKLFDSFTKSNIRFHEVWDTETKREEFISQNGLDNWFLFKFAYIPYNGYLNSSFDNKSVRNSFKYLLFALDEIYDGFLPAMEEGEFDFSQRPYPGYHFGTSRAKQTAIQQFFAITHILDEIDDYKKISFVNMSSEKMIKDQIEIDCNVVIVKLPLIDSENKELSDELRKKAEESFHKGLKTLGIEAKAYFF